jgi:hypothetical protein
VKRESVYRIDKNNCLLMNFSQTKLNCFCLRNGTFVINKTMSSDELNIAKKL